MKKLLLLLSILLIANTFTSCKKEKEADNETSQLELLTAHKWNGDDYLTYIDGTLTNTDDLTDSYLFKENFDFFRYVANGSVADQGTWQLIDGSPETLKLTLDDGSVQEYKIIKLTENELSFKLETTSNNGTIKIVFNYKK